MWSIIILVVLALIFNFMRKDAEPFSKNPYLSEADRKNYVFMRRLFTVLLVIDIILIIFFTLPFIITYLQ